ncbi:MAG TPA: hypothetical protein VF930_14805 [Stellaceae bacterium]
MGFALPKNLVVSVCGALLLAMLGGCDREEQAHEVHLSKGVYAGKPMTKLDDKQLTELERRASHGDY